MILYTHRSAVQSLHNPLVMISSHLLSYGFTDTINFKLHKSFTILLFSSNYFS